MTSHDASDAGKMPEGPYEVASMPYDEWTVQDAHGVDLCWTQNEALARLFASAPELKAEVEMARDLLSELEWSASTRGAGYGYMGSGNDGPLIPSCPICRGIHPEKGKAEFIRDALGHKSTCRLSAALARKDGPA